MESILISAKIRKGHYGQVRVIVDEGPPFDLPLPGIERHSVFIHRGAICFLFEGPPGLRKVVRSLVFNASVRGQMLRIGRHLEGPPREFDTVFAWPTEVEPTTQRERSTAEAMGSQRAIG